MGENGRLLCLTYFLFPHSLIFCLVGSNIFVSFPGAFFSGAPLNFFAVNNNGSLLLLVLLGWYIQFLYQITLSAFKMYYFNLALDHVHLLGPQGSWESLTFLPDKVEM